MTNINSFLQKLKIRESHNGTFMVIIAYILSSLLLIFGSDTFYNIGSKAERVSYSSEEETQIFYQEKVINPYGMASYLPKEPDEKPVTGAVSGDTNWLFGYSLSAEEYDRLEEAMFTSGQMQTTSAGKDTAVKTTAAVPVANVAEGTSSIQDSAKSGKNNSIKAAGNSAKKATDTVKSKAKESKSVESFSVSNKTYKMVLPITKGDVKMLERIVEAEATGEDMTGKILVANVIFNRIADDEFPDTVKGVIFQKVDGKYQFSPISDKRYWSVEVTDGTREAVRRAINGEDHSEGALYFMARKHTRKKIAGWFDNNLERLFKHGGHEFFKNR